MVRGEGRTVTLAGPVTLQESMVGREDARQSAFTAAGGVATGEALQRLETEGAPAVTGAVRWRSTGHLPTRLGRPGTPRRSTVQK